MHGGALNEPGDCRTAAAGVAGSLAVGGGAAWPAAFSARAHRRGPLPTAPLPRTRRAARPAVTHRG